MIIMIVTDDNPRPWLGRHHGTAKCSMCTNLAIGYTNWPRGGNPRFYCELHAPAVLRHISPNTLLVYDQEPSYPGGRYTHIVVGRWPDKQVEWPEYDAWAYRYRGAWLSRYSRECTRSRQQEQWEETLYWEWKVLRVVLSKYGDNWEPEEAPDGHQLCPVCLQYLTDEDYEYDREYVGEWHGIAAYQDMAQEMVCPRCGYRESI